MRLIKFLLIVVLLSVAYKQCQQSGEVALGPGVKVIDAPVQTTLKQSNPIAFDEYTLIPLAKYEIQAKVLSRENYHLGREADLSPTDLALGWEKMSDESVLEQIDIRQSGRWYRWRVEQFPIPRREIETQSANVHFVPADAAVESVLSRVKKGQLIQAEGYLIRAQASDGWHWQSSLTRNDTGNGACELFYVQDMHIISP